jgi:hypothetical protein
MLHLAAGAGAFALVTRATAAPLSDRTRPVALSARRTEPPDGERPDPRAGRHRLALVHDGHGNEALVLAAHLGGEDDALFLLDTAYAGAPVVSTSFLAVSRAARRDGHPSDDLQARYLASLAALRARPWNRAQRLAVDALLALPSGRRCRAYTSGCVMRLMGIGATTEARSDMLLCPALLPYESNAKGGATDGVGDVLVTHALPGTPHILTVDFLLHRAPCLVLPARQLLVLGAAEDGEDDFQYHPARLVGGAFAVPMRVGGTRLFIVLDTGASAPLSLAPQAVARLARCRPLASPRKATQVGVNGERVCSDVLEAHVRVTATEGRPIDLGTVQVLANSHDVEGADGYAGMGLLRALDLRFEAHRVGLRLSGLPPREAASLAHGACSRAARHMPRCATTVAGRT